MKHPVLIGILSIMPGLGYLVLGKLTKAIYVWTGMVVSFFIFLFSPYDWLADIAFFAIIIVWFYQIAWAYREARESSRLEKGEVIEAKDVTLSPSPDGLSRREKQIFKMRETIRAQLAPGQQVGPVMLVTDNARSSSGTAWYYLGVINTGLMLVKLSMRNKPKLVETISFTEIDSVEFKEPKLSFSDEMRFYIHDQKKPLRFFSARQFREQARQIASAVSQAIAPQGISHGVRLDQQ